MTDDSDPPDEFGDTILARPRTRTAKIKHVPGDGSIEIHIELEEGDNAAEFCEHFAAILRDESAIVVTVRPGRGRK